MTGNGHPEGYLTIRDVPALSADGVLAAVDDIGTLRGVFGGAVAWSVPGLGQSAGVIIGPDATLYAGAGNKVIALR